MKRKISITIITIVLCQNLINAQLKLNLNGGISIPNIQNLNNILATYGYQALPDINRVFGAEIYYRMPDGTTLHVGYNFLYQNGMRQDDRNTTLTGSYAQVLLGYRIHNREKASIELMGGTALATPMRLRLRNNQAIRTSFSNQIQNPTSTINELDFESLFYLNFAFEYRRRIRSVDLAIRGGYASRLSEAQWLTGGQVLTDIPKINPLGGYFTLSLGF